MSSNTIVIRTDPNAVFDVLTDAHTYDYWVVGCKDIRAVEPAWPAPGSAFHHKVGVGPITIRDETRVVAIERPRLLVLEAHAWPAGTAKVTLELEPVDEGTRLTLGEVPIKGPAAKLHNPALDAAAHARNAVSIRRIERLSLRRAAAG
jgi:uncharacterized protein YndB with AHSA1/START domain